MFTVIVSVVVALSALLVAAMVALSGAPSGVAAATLLAAVPVVPLLACYAWLDRYEPEPRGLLTLGLLWGAFVAVVAALVLETVGAFVTGAHDSGTSAVLAPLAEEACKGAFLLALLWWRRDELDGLLDGIVYAGMVGIGFAFTENILYLAGAADSGQLTATFVMRCIASPFAHPLFTTFTGLGVGIAVGSRSGLVRFFAPLLGYLAAVVAHGIWNGSIIFGARGYFAMYVLIMVPVFLALVGFAVWARRSERKMLVAALGDAASRGLLPATDIGWVVDLRARRRARSYARQTGGEAGLRAMRDYQQAVIELGFLHHRYLRGTAPADFAQRGQEFVARIGRVRPTIAFPGQVVPTR